MKGVTCMKYEKHKRVKYFRKQRILGGILIAIGVLSAILLEGDITAALFMVPVGLYLVFTDEPVTYGDYFYEQEAKKGRKGP